jgi:ParB family chromosome partitioning protein
MIENLDSLESDFDVQLTPGSVKSAMTAVDAKSRDLWQVPIEAIRVIPGFNVRVKNASYDQHIEDLAESILREGFKPDKPLAGYVSQEDGVNVISVVDGHCRLEAVRIAISRGAEISRLPVVVSPPGTTMEDLTVSLVSSNSGKELTPYEISLVVRRLVRFGWETQEIATKLGITPRYVAGLLQLASAPLEIRTMVMEERIAARMAIDAMRDHGDKALAFLLRAEKLANARGQRRVTNKFTPGRAIKKAITKNAPVMAKAIEDLRRDPGYAALGDDVKAQIEKVLEAFEEARKNEADAEEEVEGTSEQRQEEETTSGIPNDAEDLFAD